MPQVRKVLEAVICRLDTNRDFMPIGSEQPEVFEYTVEVRPGKETKEETEKKRNGKREKESMIDRGRTGSSPGQPVMYSGKQMMSDVEDNSSRCSVQRYRIQVNLKP